MVDWNINWIVVKFQTWSYDMNGQSLLKSCWSKRKWSRKRRPLRRLWAGHPCTLWKRMTTTPAVTRLTPRQPRGPKTTRTSRPWKPQRLPKVKLYRLPSNTIVLTREFLAEDSTKDILVNLLDDTYVPSRNVDNFDDEADTTNNEDEDDIEEFFNEIFPGIHSKTEWLSTS